MNENNINSSSDEIYQRDKYQLDIESIYAPIKGLKNNKYSIEFFFFIPKTLQINKYTYTRDQFYHDLTNLIRFKTPTISLKELISTDSLASPLVRIQKISHFNDEIERNKIKFELKLFGNMARSQIRDTVKELITQLTKAEKNESSLIELNRSIQTLCEDITQLSKTFIHFQINFFSKCPDKLLQKFSHYVDEFFQLMAEQSLLHLLQAIKSNPSPFLIPSERNLTHLIIKIQKYREEHGYHSELADYHERKLEYFSYRMSLLNKFALESLLLSTQRKEPLKHVNQLIATFAAGFAMLLYLVLLAWYGKLYIVDATEFLILSVLLYIIKDRLKEGLKSGFFRLAFKWFPDYKTKIQTPDHKRTLGLQTESFTFLEPNQISDDIKKIRREAFLSELQEAKRIEDIIYYKKEVVIKGREIDSISGLNELHEVFRFNISQFLFKASDAYEDYLEFDSKLGHLKSVKYPKVYHVNIVMKKTYQNFAGEKIVKFQKIRLVLNKEGIKRVEHLD